MNTHTTPTFRVADGMLVENARMEKPTLVNDDGRAYRNDCNVYRAHLASLRSIPIAPGCVFEKVDGLVEDKDFYVYKGVAVPYEMPEKQGSFLAVLRENHHAAMKGDGSEWEGYTPKSAVLETYEDLVSIYEKQPPARAFSLAEMLEIWEAYDEYVQVLADEIESLAGWAHLNGWKSENIERGRHARSKIAFMKKRFNQDI